MRVEVSVVGWRFFKFHVETELARNVLKSAIISTTKKPTSPDRYATIITVYVVRSY